MRVLVTGATGFIGSHLVEHLVRDGHTVRALVRPGTDVVGLAGVEIVRGDTRSAADVECATAGCASVFHLARDPDVATSEHVARAALRNHVERFVFASSTTVYGSVRDLPISERTPVRPETRYASIKAAAEDLLLALHRSDGLPVVIARLSSVFGPRLSGWRRLFESIATGTFRLIGTGANRWQPGDVADIVDGLRRCGTTPNIAGSTYVITGDEPVRLRDLVGLIAAEYGVSIKESRVPIALLRCYATLDSVVRAFGGGELPRMDRVRLFLHDRCFDLGRAKTDLGYLPKTGIGEAIQRTVAWDRDARGAPTR